MKCCPERYAVVSEWIWWSINQESAAAFIIIYSSCRSKVNCTVYSVKYLTVDSAEDEAEKLNANPAEVGVVKNGFKQIITLNIKLKRFA